ncbi:adenosylcobalamin-dependent ribonucleoside-diphosphate reductase, partial [Patescibacteria group bacterium]|nr:adenosylcobalamin-dependent ribonucleoside-diphosphate reductase [Patescibacteria group bacterium]MBU1499371.1 adenosylcobalamin-dependent ribonucleoside-diphosphate reductase [Patescibacteria group bacterium]
KAEKGLGVIDDIGLPYSSIVVMKNKYLQKGETPKGCFKRVAKAVAKAETDKKNHSIWEERFFTVMSCLRFLPGGRTLANAGTDNNQLANCFVMPMPDSVEGIFESIKESSLLKKNGGGVGFSFSRIRPKGDSVAGTSGRAAGPVAFMKIINEASEILQQAGGRRSGNMVVLHVTHPDILEFITCKEDEASLNQINFSIGLTDKFMRAVKKDKHWDLINPHTGAVVNTVSSRSIFELACSYAWKNGDPGMIFLDRINQDNPTPQVGVLEAVNLCGEQPLLNYEACNLGSINLAKHIINGNVDWDKLTETVKIAVRFLDNVVSVCKYPLKKVEAVVRANRKIGLGVMGWADLLVKLSIPYNSKAALQLAEKLQKFIRDIAWETSARLGQEKGSFKNFRGSIWGKRKYKQFRNATLTTIAPTGSISMLANCSYGIEPHFALAFYKEALGGIRLPEINKDLLVKLRQVGLDTNNGLIDQIAVSGTLQLIKEIPDEIKKIFVTAHEISFQDHVKMQAAWQKYTDNAVSKTINLAADARVEDVVKAYILAWELGCKGLTVYRDTSRRVQVLNIGYNKTSSKGSKSSKSRNPSTSLRASTCPQCKTKMLKTEGCATCPACAFSVCSL